MRATTYIRGHAYVIVLLCTCYVFCLNVHTGISLKLNCSLGYRVTLFSYNAFRKEFCKQKIRHCTCIGSVITVTKCACVAPERSCSLSLKARQR